MEINRFIWGMTVLGLLVGVSSTALGEEAKSKTDSKPSVRGTKQELLSQQVGNAQKTFVDHSVIRVADDQPVGSSKPTEAFYQPPRRGAPGGRVGGGTRGPNAGLPFLYALVPDHVGLTAKAQPTLVWYLSEATTFPLEFTVLEGMGVEPILEVPLSSPLEAGIQLISLADYDLKLDKGKTFQWFVSLIPDPARRSKDVVAGGMLEVKVVPENIALAVKNGTPQEATKLLAKAGFWYDAMGMISHEIQAHSRNRELYDLRAGLLEQVDLNIVAQLDRNSGL